MELSNSQISKKLKEVAAAYTIKGGNLFQIRAYETVAEAIEHSTSEVVDLMKEGNLNQISGIGEALRGHLEELFKTGKVKHWDQVKKGLPKGFFDFLDIPRIGPKTALKLTQMGVKNIPDLTKKLEKGKLVKQGFSLKTAQNILESLQRLKNTDQERMMLPYAFAQAEKVLKHLRQNPDIISCAALGSLRRMVATVGDLDFAIASHLPKKVADYIASMPDIFQVLDKGDTKVSLINSLDLRLDFLIVHPDSYGALLQHFTGSKSHNIHLRTIAEKKGLSLSEYGVKDAATGEIKETGTEEKFYNLMGMDTPEPEIREDTGEIEAALEHKLPNLIKIKDIKGDLHIHDNFPIEPSHDLGISDVEEIVKKAKELNYQYVGLSDHSPSTSNHTDEQINSILTKRSDWIEKYNSSNNSNKKVRVLNLLEVDIQPDGSLSVPDEGLEMLDFAIVSVHSVQNMPKEKMTQRILKALSNPYAKILGHPTNRLINKRDSSEVDWEQIFKFASANNKALEINAFPDRLDLPDMLVRQALDFGVKFVISTDSHQVSDMNNMFFGVAVARRGWATKQDIVNTWDWTKFANWFNIKS